MIFSSLDSTTATVDLRPHVVLIQDIESRAYESAISLAPDRRWTRYLETLETPSGPFAPHHVANVRSAWEQIRGRLGDRMPLPLTQPTNSGAIQLVWDVGRYYIDVDCFPDGTIHWFFRDREGAETDGTDDDRVRGIPDHLIERLRLFLKS